MTILLTILSLSLIALAVLLIAVYLKAAYWKCLHHEVVRRWNLERERHNETKKTLEGSRAVGKAALGVLNRQENDWPEEIG